MSSNISLPSKNVAEDLFISFDFLSQLDSGETISGATVTAVVFSGTDGSPSAIISGAASVSGSIVKQKIIGGVVGVIYTLSCAVTTSLGALKTIQGYLAILDSNPFEA